MTHYGFRTLRILHFLLEYESVSYLGWGWCWATMRCEDVVGQMAGSSHAVLLYQSISGTSFATNGASASIY